MSDFALSTAEELASGYARKDFSPVEVTSALLARTRRLNPKLNAFYLIDEEGALAAARLSAMRWAKGSPLSALDGVPTSVKDALPSVGHPSFRGSAAHNPAGGSADIDAPAVARMREAGMVFLGKTTMPDYGILASGYSSRHGITRNPWDLTKTPGGSSAGAAASIAAGLNPIAVGTDIVGSIRLPASFTGLYGLKPSQGRVPYYFPNSPSLVAGPMARTVRDAAMLMDVIAKPDPRDFTALPHDGVSHAGLQSAQLSGVIVRLVTDLGFGFSPDAEVVGALEAFAALLAKAGCRVDRCHTVFDKEDRDEAERFYKVRCRTELLTAPPALRVQARVISDWSAEADQMSATDFYRSFNHLQLLREKALRICDGVDYLLLPTVPSLPFDADCPGLTEAQLFEPWLNTFLFNLTEQPAVSVPCAISRSGLPIGAQIVGRRYDDQGVMRMALASEALLSFRDAANQVIARDVGSRTATEV
jgi:aspartyl-tRNA(Asn)/glutamyl-tRNA(Gln) amidotransferase subunit A